MSTSLLGKVVVVTGMRKIPKSCTRCPFYDNMGGRSGHINNGVCTATGSYRSTEGIQVTKMRLDSCPLKLDDDGHGKNKPLTIEELRKMNGEAVWVAGENTWAIVCVDSNGQYQGRPFAMFRYENIRCEYDIQKRGLRCYRQKPKG